MRGNSGFLRWLPSSSNNNKSTSSRRGVHTARTASSCRFHTISMEYSRAITIAILSVFLTAAFTPSTDAGPVNHRRTRMTRDYYSDFEVNPQNDTDTTGTCLQNGVQVASSSVQCEKKSGCREIQKTGYCCPDYQCDCETGNKTYSNGEKLLDHENPCKVCYCQGGEITCIDLKCYVRNDCEPKYTPGICCPEYDNCPPLEDVKPSINKDSETISNSAAIDSSSPATVKQELPLNGNPLGIKIKETTKAEEIRIIDDKPKPTYSITKPSDSSNSNQPKTYPPVPQNRLEPTSTDNNQSAEKDKTTSSSESLSLSTTSAPTTDSHEVLNKLENTDVNYIDDEDGTKSVRHANVSNETKVETSSNENSNEEAPKPTSSASAEVPEEVMSEDKPASSSEAPAATENGSKVVVVDENGQKQPFTVFGVEGLQRGDVNDELTDYDEKKVTSKRSDTNSTIAGKASDNETSATELQVDPPQYDSVEDEIFSNDTNSTYVNDEGDTEDRGSENFEPIASSSDDFVRIIITTKKPSDNSFSVEGSGSAENSSAERIYDTVYYTSPPETIVLEDEVGSNETLFDTVYHDTVSTNDPSSASNVYDLGTHIHPHLTDLVEDDTNPAYPTIKDDDYSVSKDVHTLAYYEEDTEASHATNTTEGAKHHHSVDEFRSNSSQNSDSETPSIVQKDGLKAENSSQSSPVSIPPQQRSPGEPLLIPEWERNSTESSTEPGDIVNKDDLSKESREMSSESPVELVEGSGSDSGSESHADIKQKDREPTTPRVSKFLKDDDIETVSDSSLEKVQHDPKEDAESLKAEEGDAEKEPIVKYTAPDPVLQATFGALQVFNKFVIGSS